MACAGYRDLASTMLRLARCLHEEYGSYISTHTHEENIMLSWAITFLVIALIAGVLGFGGIMSTSAGIAKILFVIFLILFIVSMIANAMRGRPVA